MTNALTSLQRNLLQHRSVALIGASTAAHKAGGRRWLSALGAHDGVELYPVHPTATTLNGKKAYKSLAEIKKPIDLAVVMVPSDFVSEAVDQCAAAQVGAVVVVSAGFGETGEAGRLAESQMVQTLREKNVRMLGPNSAGVFSAATGVNTLGWAIPGGKIGLITQSGNIALSFTRYAKARKCGFSAVLAVGNGADLSVSELVEVLLADPQTATILIYCEGFKESDGRRLVDVISRSTIKKPIVILKPGASEEGRKAVQSHTGSLAGDDIVADAAFKANGIIRAQAVDEAFDLSVAFAAGKKLTTRQVAVVSDGGGHATMVAEAAGRLGIKLSVFSPETLKKLGGILPIRGGIHNPVDYAGLAESDPACIPPSIQACLDDPNVGGVIFAGHFGGYHLMTSDPEAQASMSAKETAAAKMLAEIATKSSKPVFVHSDHADSHPATLMPLYEAGVPLFSKLEAPALGIARLECTSEEQPATQPVADHHAVEHTSDQQVLLEDVCRAKLAAVGIPLPAHQVVATAENAASAFGKFEEPIAMKLVSPKAIHKSDVGGVVLNVRDSKEASSAADSLLNIAKKLGDDTASVLMTPMVSKGIECFIGAKMDPSFGPTLFFGAGGVLIEIMRDVNCALAPMSQTEAEALVDSSRIAPLLSGYRGTSTVQKEALIKLIQVVSQFCWDERHHLIELDLNPVIVNETGAHIVDARMVVG